MRLVARNHPWSGLGSPPPPLSPLFDKQTVQIVPIMDGSESYIRGKAGAAVIRPYLCNSRACFFFFYQILYAPGRCLDNKMLRQHDHAEHPVEHDAQCLQAQSREFLPMMKKK